MLINPSRARFSTDEGQCWYWYAFSKDPIFFTGLASEPGARSMNVSIWGFRGSFLSRKWVSYTIDFSELLSRTCESCWGQPGAGDNQGWGQLGLGWGMLFAPALGAGDVSRVFPRGVWPLVPTVGTV